MAGLEGVIRPWVSDPVNPTSIKQPSPQAQPMVRLSIGLVGGSKTFSYSGSSSLSSYMADVHTESAVDNFDLTTLKAKGPGGG